jgi:hypothetical protein
VQNLHLHFPTHHILERIRYNLETDQSSPLGGGGREGPQNRDELDR